MAPEPIRLLVIDADADTPSVLKSLLRGRIERPYVIDAAASPESGEYHSYDVLIQEIDTQSGLSEQDIVERVRRASAHGGAPPLVLLRGTRNRALEPVLLAAGAIDFIWAEELSAPLLESQVRHALDARNQAILERSFHEAQKMDTVGRLAGGVAHEFNNILTAIIGFGTLVGDQVNGDESAAGNVAEIMKAAERASVLTRQLLAFGQRQILHPVRLQLDETVQGISSLIARLIGVDIDLKIACPPMPPVRADQGQIESALLNLVINARDAMPNGGRLTIETSELTLDERYCDTHVAVLPGRYVRLAVSDTGTGIPEQAQEQIFEPFFAVRDASRTNGLGLAAVYGIVKQSGGHILVYSEEGIGTTFKLYLPVDESACDRQEPPADARVARGDGTILVVDDGDGIRRLAGEVIRRAGYRVIEASGPSEALTRAAEYEGVIDLLLTDIVMPGGNGVELAEHLTSRRPGLAVLYMSGYTDDAAVRNGVLAGQAAFIQKPFTPHDLLHKVQHVLDGNDV